MITTKRLCPDCGKPMTSWLNIEANRLDYECEYCEAENATQPIIPVDPMTLDRIKAESVLDQILMIPRRVEVEFESFGLDKKSVAAVSVRTKAAYTTVAEWFHKAGASIEWCVDKPDGYRIAYTVKG